MISFSFLLIPLILVFIVLVLILIISCIWIIQFYLRPNRIRMKYKPFYQRQNPRNENFFDDDITLSLNSSGK